MTDSDYFGAILLVLCFISCCAIYARDQYRMVKERALMCDAIAKALERVPPSYDRGASWVVGEIQQELVKAGWEPFP